MRNTDKNNGNHRGGIQRFEDLIAWQKARALVREIYRVTQSGRFSADHGLSRQIQRASVSIMSNIAEGFERHNSNEFRHYLRISKASCAEVLFQLYVAIDIGYLERAEFERLSELSREVGRVIAGLRSSVERQSNIPPGN